MKKEEWLKKGYVDEPVEKALAFQQIDDFKLIIVY